MKRGPELDKGCVALIAIARASTAWITMASSSTSPACGTFSWSQAGVVLSDTAMELRAVCAMGLASTTYSDKLRELVNLLVDREWQARAGAVRAITAVGSDAAIAVAAVQALSGDKEPEVLSECFSGLLAVEGAEALRW